MNYKMIFYVFCVLLSTFTVSGMNINKLFKQNHIWEERIFVVIISVILGYLLANFIIDFLTMSKIA